MSSGGINIEGGAIRSNKSSFADTSPGWWMGRDGGHAKLHIGNASKALKWDSNTGALEITGADIKLGAKTSATDAANSGAYFASAGDFIIGRNATNFIKNSAAGLEIRGSLNADDITAGVISASRLLISDTSNICPDANMRDNAAWFNVTAWVMAPTTGWRSYRVAQLDGASNAWVTSRSKAFPVEAGASLYVSAQLQMLAGTGTVFAQMRWGATDDLANPTYNNIGSTSSTTLVEVAMTVTVPAGVKYAWVELVKSNNGTTSCYAGGVIVRRAVSSELIVNGAITADKITATGLDITSANGNNIRGGKANYAATTNGWWLGWDSSTAKFALGTVSEDGTTGVGLRWTGSNLVVRGAINADDIIGGTITGRTLQTAASGTRFVVSSVDGEGHFFGDRGDGTIVELATIGISTYGDDEVVGVFGASGSTRIGVLALSASNIALVANSTSGTGASISGDGTGLNCTAQANDGTGIFGRAWGQRGTGVYGFCNATDGIGVHAGGTIPLRVASLGNLPASRVAGNVCFYGGWLCFANGTHWFRSNGVQLT
jgi:hypothetical protein